jgi:hypothetical protein
MQQLLPHFCVAATCRIETQFIFFIFFFCPPCPFEFSRRQTPFQHGIVYASVILQTK